MAREFKVDWAAADSDFVGIAITGIDETGYAINWGDGSPVEAVNEIFPDTAVAARAYAADGLYQVYVHDRPNDPATPVFKMLAYLYSGSATDLNIAATSKNDLVLGGVGNDTFRTGKGNDWLDGGADGDDRFFSGEGNDVIFGDIGNDFARAAQGNDYVSGGEGNDTLYGDAGYDVMFGDEGNDKIFGGSEEDRLDGGSGDDRLYGDDGDDFLFGGSGRDYLTGGAGDDTFFFDLPCGCGAPTLASNRDVIRDFTTGEDIIDLSAFADYVGDLTFLDYGQGFSGAGAEVRLAVNSSGNTGVQIDLDGDRRVDFDFVVNGTTSLQESDFILGSCGCGIV